MIPCQLCGRDSKGHWLVGFIPAPDSQKLALCAEHDTAENRNDIQKLWQQQQVSEIALQGQNRLHFMREAELFMLSIYFTAGGGLTLPCREATITPQNTLKVVSPDGTLDFFPMQQILRYTMTPNHGSNSALKTV